MRKLMWFTVGFAGACLAAAYVLGGGWILPLALLCVAALFALRRKELPKIVMVLFGCIVGLLWYQMFLLNRVAPAATYDDQKMQITVTVLDYPEETAYGVRVQGNAALDGRKYKIRIYLNGKTELTPGDTVTGTFLLRCTGRQEKSVYSSLSAEGTLLIGYQRGEVTISPGNGENWRYFAPKLAQNIKLRLKALFPEDVFAFTQALLLGDSSKLDYETDSALKISGIRHIIAVSGLHVAILYSVLRAVTLRRRWLTMLLGIPALAVFAAVAGFTPSVTRACIMVGLMMIAQTVDQEYDSATALAASVLVMLAVNPLAITSVSLQLSVGCVCGILLFREPIALWLEKKMGKPKGKSIKARLARWLIGSVSVTLSSMSLTTPLSAWYFGVVSLIGVVTNLLTLWVVNFIFVGLVLICLGSLVWMGGASAFAWLLSWPIRYVLWLAKLLARVPIAAVYTKSVYICAWLVLVYILLGIYLVHARKQPAVLACCSALGLCAALIASWAEPLTDNVRMTVLDVGQGQSILLQSEGHAYLVDCGGDSDAWVADTVAETLLSQGLTRLDGIILTHGDYDHAGAVENLLSRVQTDLLLLPATTAQETIDSLTIAAEGEVVAVNKDMQLTFGSVNIRIFGPILASSSNENSLCVLFDSQNCDILITGDRGELGENMLLREHDLPDVDVLIAGHHGSKYSTTEALLQTVQPEVVIISVGEGNNYGHPAQELLDRLAAFGCQVFRTDENGTIIIRR